MDSLLTSLRELEDKIAQRERLLAGEQERRDALVSEAADALEKAAEELSKAGREMAEQLDERAKLLQEAAAAMRPGATQLSSSAREMRDVRRKAGSFLLQLATTSLGSAQANTASALARLEEVSRKQQEPLANPSTDAPLRMLRAQHHELLARLQRHERVRPDDSPGNDELCEPNTTHASKIPEDFWDDLPPLQGAAALARECQRCGRDVPRGRKRFCSRDCHQLYLESHGATDGTRAHQNYDYGTYDPEEERWGDGAMGRWGDPEYS
jgi:endogenous inhibitor of DNA gyrase (YacG/DUF329 family)